VLFGAEKAVLNNGNGGDIMDKRIVICADGTWNRPEKDLKQDFPTNVLRLSRAIKPVGADQAAQQVFYDWGVGSGFDI